MRISDSDELAFIFMTGRKFERRGWFQPTFGLSFPSRFTSPLRQFLEMFLKRGGGSSKNEVDKVQAGIRVAKNKYH
jgi:hypothetical protein